MTGKQIFCWPKGTSLECVELIYVKITETACVRLLKEEDRQIVSLGDSRVRDNVAFSVRVVVLEYNQLHKKA